MILTETGAVHGTEMFFQNIGKADYQCITSGNTELFIKHLQTVEVEGNHSHGSVSCFTFRTVGKIKETGHGRKICKQIPLIPGENHEKVDQSAQGYILNKTVEEFHIQHSSAEGRTASKKMKLAAGGYSGLIPFNQPLTNHCGIGFGCKTAPGSSGNFQKFFRTETLHDFHHGTVGIENFTTAVGTTDQKTARHI